MLKFKTFQDTDIKAVENQVNNYIKENELYKDDIIDFTVKHDQELYEHCVTILHR